MSSLFTDTIRKTGGTAGTDIKINNSSTYVDGSNKSTNMVKAVTVEYKQHTVCETVILNCTILC